ncbi:MAG: class I SAM-dependent methyltransferase [Acidobacteriota bacterium]
MQVVTNGHATVTPERIFQFTWGFTTSLTIEAALHHHFFDAIEAGARTVAEVAAAAGTSLRGTRILLNALTGLQFLTKQDEKYALAPDAAEFLVSKKPAYLGGFVRHLVRNTLPIWMNLPEVVRTSEPIRTVSEEEDGSKYFEAFVADLFPVNYITARALAEHLKLSESKEPVSVLDLAAGSGVWGIALAQSSPKVNVTAVDWEGVIPVTKKSAEKFHLTDRFTFVPDSLENADLGDGHSIATLGHILHSEGEFRSRDLLKRIFGALKPGGTIAIAEWLVNEDRTAPLPPLLFALTMLLMTKDGDTFSFEEIRSWLEEIGFENVRLVDVPSISPLVLATKPK